MVTPRTAAANHRGPTRTKHGLVPRLVRPVLPPPFVTLATTARVVLLEPEERSLKSLKSLEMTQARGHKKNRPRAASTEEPPLTDSSPAAAASKSCEGYLSRLAKAEAVSSMPR